MKPRQVLHARTRLEDTDAEHTDTEHTEPLNETPSLRFKVYALNLSTWIRLVEFYKLWQSATNHSYHLN